MIDKILQYLNNEMPKDERKAFEIKIEEDKELRKQVELNKEIDRFLVKKNELNDIKDLVINIHKDYIEKRHTKAQNIKRIRAVLAAASVLLLLGLLVASIIVVHSPAYIYSHNFTAFNTNKITRGNSDLNEQYMLWHGLYQVQNYKQVLNNFNKLPANYQNETSITLMYSCALMQTGDYKKALVQLNTATVENNTLLLAELAWYKALCYLKLDDYTSAIHEFNKLTTTSKKHGKKAKAIIKKLKRVNRGATPK